MPDTARRLIGVALWLAAVPAALFGLLLIAFRNDEGGNTTVRVGDSHYDAGSAGIALLCLAFALVGLGVVVFRSRRAASG